MAAKSPRIYLVLSLLAAVLCLILQSFVHYPVLTALKSLPILFLILFTNNRSELENKNLVLLALLFSLLGDIVLSLPLENVLKLGIAFFIMAQAVYIRLFLKSSQDKFKNKALLVPLLCFIGFSFYFLLPFLGEMARPMLIYAAWLTVFIFSAFQVKEQGAIIGIASLLFLLSDFFFSLNRFIFLDDKLIAVLVTYLYLSAQILFVLGLVGTKQQLENTALELPAVA